MTMFTRRCSRQLKTWRAEFASGFKIFLSLILMSSFFATVVRAQGVGTAPVPIPVGGLRIDGFLPRQGNPGDWFAGNAPFNAPLTFLFNPNGTSQYPAFLNQTLFWKIDAYTLNGTVFNGPEDRIVQGSKLNEDPNTWHWDDHAPQSKDDINNAFFFLVSDGINHVAPEVPGPHYWALMAGDREATNGTSFLDFEFLQHSITKNADGTFTATGPNDGRTVGDIDVTLDYTGGGSVPTISVFQWNPVGDGTFTYSSLTPGPGTFFAEPNRTNGTPFPGLSGAFGLNNYPDSLMFVEGAIDITALLGAGIATPCRALPFTSIFIKTKSSASVTAELKDFIAPFAINICTDNVPPTITATGTPANGQLGCNPTSGAINAALGSASATDACSTPTVTTSDGSVLTSGCLRSQTRTFRATDDCGNTASTSRTATWTVDVTAPVITTGGTPANGVLGCNPSSAAIDAALGTATATDACGTPTVTTSTGNVTSNGCLRNQTRTWTATDACGNTATASRTATWTFDVTAPTITATGTTNTLGCNPSSAAIDAALGSASATDACGGATVGTPSDGAVQSSGCSRSQTRTFTATDACGNTASTSRTVTWTFDVTPPTIILSPATSLNLCNPSSAQIDAALGSASATDACGGATITNVTTGGVTGDCVKSQTRTFTATDVCGNTASTSRTVQFSSDNIPPTITATGTPANGVLGCNPSAAAIDAALGSASATDNCGTPTVTSSNGPVLSSGCLRTQVRTFTATDVCGNTATTSRTATWTADLTAPTITATGSPLALGCNPSSAAIEAALGSASATDACGTPTVTSVTGSVGSDGCLRLQTRTFTATDACGNTATTSRTATWTLDVTAPTIVATGGSLTLGCNPSTATIDGALGSASATDACGTPTVTSSTGDVQASGCSRSQTRTFTATDACGNTATTSRTATWTADLTAPTITATGGSLTLGCNPSSATIEGSLGSASATDACGTPTVTSTTGAPQGTGCTRTQVRTFTATDFCGNTATTSRTVTWIVDVTAPVITATGTPANGQLGCNPTSAAIEAALGAATATDACSTPTVTSSTGSIISSGCLRTQVRTFTATDACGNVATTSRTATWTFDVTPPVITTTGTPANGNIEGCTPTSAQIQAALGSATATDACGAASITFSDGPVQSSGCDFSQTRRWTATDACGNTATASRTATWHCCPTVFCTFTQGFWGNKNGLRYLCDSGLLNTQIIIGSVAGNSVLIPTTACHDLNAVMPGGGTPGPLTFTGQCNITLDCFDNYLTKQGRINNVLLSQTITLSLNVRLDNSILNLPPFVSGQCLLIDGDTVEINQNVVNYLICKGTPTVAGVLALANALLGGVVKPGDNVGGCIVPSYGDINEAVSTLNEGFDECRNFLGFGACTDVTSRTVARPFTESFASTDYLKVTAYPNPFKSTVRFTIQSTVSGQAQLEVYNTNGQRVGVAYSGYLMANRGQVVEYKAPRLGSNFIYLLRVGGKQVTGKLLRLE